MHKGSQHCKIPMPGGLQELPPGCLFKELLSMARVGYLVTSPDGTIRYLNKAYADMFQLDMEKAVGSNICRFFPNSRLLTVMRSGIADEGIIFSYKGRDAFISRYPILLDGEIVGGYIEVYWRDISQLNDLANRLHILERKVHLYHEHAASLPRARYSFNDIISQCPVIEDLKAKARKYAQTDLPVLIIGETGTGKELLAHSLHALSARSREPFVTVNCAAIPENLLESELFGFEEGTFTGARQGGQPGKFELANGGTIFLDEIGTLSLPLQAKLLRVIESKEIQKLGKSRLVPSDFRLIAATNVDLWKSVEKGVFRRDLLYRLCSLYLHLPPLRERTGDIPLLVRHQLSSLETSGTYGCIQVHPDTMALLERYPWPGNVRELRNLVNAAVIALDDRSGEIMPHHLPANAMGVFAARTAVEGLPPARMLENMSLKQARYASEHEMIMAAVREAGGNKSRAAGLLGISRNELYRKLRKHVTA